MPTPTPESWTQIRHDYEHTERPVAEICAEHGISPGTLRDRMRRWGWTRRRELVPAEGPPPAPAPHFDTATPPLPLLPAPLVGAVELSLPYAPDNASPRDDAGTPAGNDAALIVPRLQGAVARVLPAIEAIIGKLASGPAHPREMERAARALAALMRTLRELNTLLSQHQASTTCACRDMPEDIDEFRLDLARRIDAFLTSRSGEADDGAEVEQEAGGVIEEPEAPFDARTRAMPSIRQL